MLIMFGLLLAFALIVGCVAFVIRGRENERAQIMKQRVHAYMQTIRREADKPELAAMSDDELRDLLLASAYNLRQQADRRWFFLIVGIVAVFVAALVVAIENGSMGFGVSLIIGALALYGLNEYIGRRMREPLTARGIDVDRLRVD